MANYSLQINATDQSDKKVTTNVQHINGSASNAVLLQFARKLNALTQNEFDGAVKITKEDITDE